MFTRQLLLVQGCPRSGTTLVNRVLNTHPEITITNEIDLVQIYQSLETVLFKKKKSFGKNKIWRPLSGMEDNVFDNIEQFYPADCSIIPPILENLCVSTKGKSEVKIYGDKTPTYYLYEIEQILKLSARQLVKIIHITRNPDDVISSIKWRTSNALKGKDTWRSVLTRSDAIYHWKKAWNFRNTLKQHPNINILDLNYDCFIRDPKQCFDLISDFLDVTNEFDFSFVKRKMNDDPIFKGKYSTLFNYDFRTLNLDSNKEIFPIEKISLKSRLERKFKRAIINTLLKN